MDARPYPFALFGGMLQARVLCLLVGRWFACLSLSAYGCLCVCLSIYLPVRQSVYLPPSLSLTHIHTLTQSIVKCLHCERQSFATDPMEDLGALLLMLLLWWYCVMCLVCFCGIVLCAWM